MATRRQASPVGARVAARLVLHSGRAVLMTTMILSVGFGLNTASTFSGNQTFGALGVVLVVSGWLSNQFVLPAVLTLLTTVSAAFRRRARRAAPVPTNGRRAGGSPQATPGRSRSAGRVPDPAGST